MNSIEANAQFLAFLRRFPAANERTGLHPQIAPITPIQDYGLPQSSLCLIRVHLTLARSVEPRNLRMGAVLSPAM